MISFHKNIWLMTVVIFLLSIVTMTSAATPSSYVNLFTTFTTILSGGLTSCANPTVVTSTDCLGGIASADAFVRNFTNVTNEPFLFSWTLDRNSPVVQMHPLDWGFNRFVVTEIFNYSHFRATHAALTSNRNMSYLQNENFPFLISNALVPPSNLWIPYIQTVHFDTKTKIAFISIQSGREPNSFNSLTSAQAALEIVSRRSAGPWYPVIFFDDETIAIQAFVSYITDSSKVVLKPAAIITTFASFDFYQANGTWVAGFTESETLIFHHRFGIDPTIPSAFASAERRTSDITKISVSIKDSYYVEKQVALKIEANKAAANDPVVGQTGFMPFTRTGEFRMCYRGDCESGALWTDATKWKTNADFSFESAGGLRGPGWPAGPVKISNLWSTVPFANTLCTGKISGVTLYKIMNYSISQATFTSTRTNTGDRLLQVSGLRITYNTVLLPATDRLVNIEVLNKQTNQYEPIERLKIYTYATNDFVCRSFDPFPSFFSAVEIEGEQKPTIQDGLIQEIVAQYLTSVGGATYDTSVKGRFVNQTTAVAAMKSLVQTRATCSPDTFWRDEIKTCVHCPNGFVNPNPQESNTCVPKAEEKDITPLAAGIAVPVAILILVGIFYYFYRKDKLMRENVRDLEHAPKVTGALAAMIFTDIQSSTALWSTAPLSMSVALDQHNKIINEIIARNHAYYVKSQGDSFFIAYDCTRDESIDGCRGPQIAAKICMDIQREMMKTSFPAAINQIYNAASEDELLDVFDDPNEIAEAEEGALFNGLRIRIGLAIGTCEVKFDEVAKSYDYFGSLVNLAARTEASAQGGQVLITNDSTQFVKASDLDAMLTSFGKFELKGIPDSVELWQLMPIELSGRKKFLGTGGGAKKVVVEGNEGGDHETASEFSSNNGSSEINMDSDDVNFLNALLRAVKPKEKESIVRTLENSWRVRHHKDINDTIGAIANKVGRVKTMMALQEERKAVRDGRTARSGQSNVTGANGGERGNKPSLSSLAKSRQTTQQQHQQQHGTNSNKYKLSSANGSLDQSGGTAGFDNGMESPPMTPHQIPPGGIGSSFVQMPNARSSTENTPPVTPH